MRIPANGTATGAQNQAISCRCQGVRIRNAALVTIDAKIALAKIECPAQKQCHRTLGSKREVLVGMRRMASEAPDRGRLSNRDRSVRIHH